MADRKHSFWDLFSMTEGGRLKSTFLLYSFALSFLFLAVYGASYGLLIDPIHGALAPVSPGLAGAMESLLPAVAGSAVCALCQKLARDKRLAVAAFGWLAVYALVVTVACLTVFGPEDREALLRLLAQAALWPLLLGGGWTVWALYMHQKRQAGV